MNSPMDTSFDTGLPLGRLLALAMAGFLAIMTETLPAGLLPQIGTGLAVSEAMAGQMVTLYALGSVLAAIPVVAATRGLRRRPPRAASGAGRCSWRRWAGCCCSTASPRCPATTA